MLPLIAGVALPTNAARAALPSSIPTASTLPTVAHLDPLAAPGPVVTPEPVAHLDPLAAPGPVVTPEPVTHLDPLAAPGPVATPEPVAHLDPLAAPGPVVTPEPVAHLDPLAAPGPVATPEPVAHLDPLAAPGPVVTPEPVAHLDPLAAPGPVVTPEPVAHLDPLAAPGPVVTPEPVAHLDPLSGPSLVDLPAPLTGLRSLSAYATTANARSAANVLDQLLARDPTDPAASTLTSAQTQLVVTATSLQPAQAQQFLTALGGQIHAAMVAVAPEAGQQMEGSVYDHLGDATSEPSTGPLVWGNVSTEFGQRGNDSAAGSFTSNVTQFVVGADLLARGKARLGLGYAYTTDTVTQGSSNGAAHENAGFVYGQVPVGQFMVEGIGSYGASSTDTQRADPLGGGLLQANGVGGNDALVSLGISRPFTLRNVTLAPYGRVTWQQVSEASYSEDSSSAAALSVDSFAGTGVRSVIGLTAGSVATSPLAAPTTYRFDLGVGEDAGNLLNPTLRANLAGISMTIASPQVSSTFVQASVSGTARLSPRAYLYGQLFGEARGNAAMGGISGGVRIRF